MEIIYDFLPINEVWFDYIDVCVNLVVSIHCFEFKYPEINLYTLSFSASSTREFCANVPTYVNRYFQMIYRKLSNIRRTKSQNLNDSRLVLHLSSPNLLKPGVK